MSHHRFGIRGARWWVVFLSLVWVLPAAAQIPTAQPAATGPIKALVRFPTIHGNRIVFEAGGNLWETTLQGGVATRLTSDDGFDSHPHFSPNGKWVAFTGWYQGNSDVYVISAKGGPVHRLTYHSINSRNNGKLAPRSDNLVMGWTHDGNKIIFLSRRHSWNPQMFQAYEVPFHGGLPIEIHLPWTGPLSFNTDDTAVAYNPLFRNASFDRKHYYGGQAQNIWIYNFKTNHSEEVTHWKGTDTFPMWHGDTLYFASDRGPANILNLWAYSLKTHQFRQLTHFKEYGVDWPSLGSDAIVFSDGGGLYVVNLTSDQVKQVSVRIPMDGARIQPHWYQASKMIRSYDVAPNGKLALFGARGDLFTVPSKYGNTTDLTQTPGARERDAAWSPNGKLVAYITDTNGHSEIAVRPASGHGQGRFLTHTQNVGYQGPLTWSPNSQWLTYSDSNQVLWLENVASGHRYRVSQDKYAIIGAFPHVGWSPDSRWFAFAEGQPDQMQALYLYNVPNQQLHRISDGWYSDSNPTFSRNGKYLIFASARLANPALSEIDENVVALDTDGLYMTTLQSSTPSPFAPRSESPVPGTHGKSAPGPATHSGSAKAPQKPEVKIDLKGLMARAVRVPVPEANISEIAEAKGVIYYLTSPNPVLTGPLPGEQPTLRAYDLNKRKGHALVSGVSSGGFSLSADGSTLLYSTGDSWFLRPAKYSTQVKPHKLDISHMRMWVVPRKEWNEIFANAWRDVNDYFVNPMLIKQKWGKLGEKYRKLLPLAACRQDINWIIGNMIGSLGESHMYVFGGAFSHGKFSPTADLGADFALNTKTGRYYLVRIFHGDNTIPGYRAPLDQPGLKVKAGDYVLAINGHRLKAPQNPYRFLNGTLGTTVSLKLSANASGTHAWTIKVKPVANGSKLRLLAWTRHNREVVNKLSHGKIGYMYMYDMETMGMREFIHQYYSQLNKPGLIIDERWNLGGFIDPILFERLTRKMAAMWVIRRGTYQQTPGRAYPGYMAAVINHGSASDGDIFAYMFQHYHLGPTIGTRTWGGVRGYEAPFTLVDGGHLVVSEIAMYGLNSKWVVENIGVNPSIRVPEPAAAINAGHDPQLDKAVQVLMHKIKTHPKKLPPPPPWMPAFPAQPHYPPCPAAPTCG